MDEIGNIINKSIWNNGHQTNQSESFQVMNMQYKIKKIKDNKNKNKNKNKYSENYKNIPLF